MKQKLWAFRPTNENKSLISKALTRVVRQARKARQPINPNRLKSALINEAIRVTYGDLAGKREGAPVPIPILIAEARTEARSEAGGVPPGNGARVDTGDTCAG